MSSFAVNRPCVNKGTGLSPGVWLFEEFYFQYGKPMADHEIGIVRVLGSGVVDNLTEGKE